LESEAGGDTAMNSRRILLCGHRSFAAQGLTEILRDAGHSVVTFSRGPVQRKDDAVTGPVEQLHENPHFSENFDVVLNYVLLKDGTIAENDIYLESLLKFCADKKVSHLVHVSSMSVYKGEVRVVNEQAEVETIPQRKGSYGSLKVAQDLYLNAHTPAELRLTMLRPGFILAPGLLDPMIGMGLRMFLNKVLLLGAKKNHLPVTTRDQVNQAAAKLIDLPAESNRDAFLIADPNSPTRLEWLQACCELLGCGTGVVSFPAMLWTMAGWFGEPVAKLAGLPISPKKIMSNVCRVQRFDTTQSQGKLGISMKVDWRTAMQESFAGEKPNFELPFREIEKTPLRAHKIAFVGFGRIVKQKHLPALKYLEYDGEVAAYDVTARQEDGRAIQALTNDTKLAGNDLVVLVSPGNAHTQAIPLLATCDAPLLVEKPLCTNADELLRWEEFEKSRSAPIRVCQNYRFKTNVARMMWHLAKYNPGRLLRVDVNFQSPSVGKDSRTWARDERRAQTLLLDYSVHFLDIACMFNTQQWKLEQSRYELDHLGYTALIEGKLASPQYGVNFILRQGLMPRRARLWFTFQNYGVSLGFFPDTFVAHMADDGAALYAAEKRESARATRSKIIDKLTHRDSDHSHAAAYLAAISDREGLGKSLSVENVSAFYRAVFELGHAVYG
jgi:nucleoside-diphosphate-sugar epimerase